MKRTLITFLLVLGICQAYFPNEIVYDKDLPLKKLDVGYRLPSDVAIPIAYKVHVAPDLIASSFAGEVEITLKTLVTNDTLTLNSKNIAVYGARLQDLNTTESLEARVLQDENHDILTLITHDYFKKDHYYTVYIKYNGILNDQRRGFYRNRIMRKGDVIGYTATTHFEPTGARQAFPCWDEPMYKAKFTVSITHDNRYQAISNTEPVSVEDIGNGKMTTTFKQTPRMSTYLVAFLITDYQFKEDKVGNFTHRVWTHRNSIHRVDYALEMVRKITEQLSWYTDIPFQRYMTDKIDHITQTDFLPDAMENWGLIIYREGALLYDEKTSTTREKFNVLTVMAHELAHQWFGNIVSPKWWKYIWLNEGFATYFQYYIIHKIAGGMVVPELRFDDMFVVESMQPVAMMTDASAMTRRMNFDVKSPDQIRKIFDHIAYEKAGSVIRMMSYAMTEEVFQKGMKLYLTKHELGNADSNDLFESLQKAMDESRIRWKQPLIILMNNWVETGGYPTLTAKRVKGGYQLTQERFVIVTTTSGIFPTKWWIPINYVEERLPDFLNTTAADWLSPYDESYIVPSKQKTGWFVFNAQQTGYYRVNYEEENWKLLMKELNKGNRTRIHVVNRAQMIDDTFNLARVDDLSYLVPLNLSLFLKHEADYVPWRPAFRHLGFLRNLLRTSNRRYTFWRYVTYLLRTITKDVGYEPKANDNDLVKMLRVDAMRWACEAGVKNCTSYAEKMYEQWLRDPNTKLDVDLRKEILCAGIRTANESAWTKSLEYITILTPDAKVALACSNSSEILRKYLYSTLKSDSPLNFKIAATHVAVMHNGGPQIVFDFIHDEYDRIKEIEDFENPLTEVAVAIADGITIQEQYTKLNGFMLGKGLAGALERAMLKTTRNILWLGSHQPTIEKWLSANSEVFERPDNSAKPIAVASFLVIFSLFVTIFDFTNVTL